MASYYENPVHSFIVGPTDSVWSSKKYFTPQKIDKIRQYKSKFVPLLTNDTQNCIDDFYKR